MSKGRQTFRQGDVTRAIRATTAAGNQVKRVEIDKDGRIILVIGKPDNSECKNPWDEVYEKRH